METTLIVLMIIAAVLLTLVVLIQNPKGGGLSSEIGGGSRVFGVQQTGDILEKITWGAASFIMVGALVIQLFSGNGNSTQIDSPNINAAQSKTTGPAVTPQATPAAPATAPSAAPATTPAPAKK
jgi:preprotein translocase subunit SecG